MDTTALRSAYRELLDAASRPDLGDARDGGWNADQVLAHLLSVDSSIAAVALGVVSGSRPTFDNRICLTIINGGCSVLLTVGAARAMPSLCGTRRVAG